VRAEFLADPERPLRIQAFFSAAGLTPADGAFQPGTVAMFDWNVPFADSSRIAPVAFPYPLAVSDTIRLRFSGSPGSADPPSFSGSDSCGIGDASWRWEFLPSGEWRYARTVRLSGIRVDRPDYADFRAFLNRVALNDKRTVRILRRSGSDAVR
jgi:hypothetical protein